MILYYLCKELNTHNMKKNLLFILMFVFSSSIFAQITVTTTDLPSSSSKIRLSTALTAGSIDYTLTGANYNWDFSTLVSVSQTIDTFVTVASTSLYYYPSFILSANQAEKQPNMNLLIFTLSNTYNFYKNSSASYSEIGYGTQFSVIPVPIPLKYDNPDVMYKFPLNYNNVDSCASNGNVSLPTLGYYGEKKTRHNLVDGWGSITTPYGTFNALRVKSVITVMDSLHLDTIMTFPINITRNITEYKWIAKNLGYPLLTITETSTGGLPATKTYVYMDSLRQFAGIQSNNINKAINLKISPNPAKDQINIEYNINASADVDISVFDLTGKKVKTLLKNKQDKGEYELPVSLQAEGFNKGIYFIKLTVNNNCTVKKLVVM